MPVLLSLLLKSARYVRADVVRYALRQGWLRET